MGVATPVELKTAIARAGDRVAGGFLLLLMAGGSLALWIAVPIGCWQVAWKLGRTDGEMFLIALPLTVAAMIAVGSLLVRLNRLYLRVSGTIARYAAEEAEFGQGASPRFLRGPLEPLLVASLVIAIVVLAMWFLLFAHSLNPSTSVAP